MALSVSIPADTWTKAATNVTTGNININKLLPPTMYFYYCATGASAPTGLTLGTMFTEVENQISNSSAIDIYVYSVGVASTVIVY